MVPCLRAKTPAERLDMAAEMWRYACRVHLDLARHQHPDWSPEEIHREARRRLNAGREHGVTFWMKLPSGSKDLAFRMSPSEKHLRDIAGILKLCTFPIDREYIAVWAQRVGALDTWELILSKVEGAS